jgi:N utilization substance protein A
MAKKKTKKKPTQPKKSAKKNRKPIKKAAKKTPPKKLKSRKKKAPAKSKALAKKKASGAKASAPRRGTRARGYRADGEVAAREDQRARAGGQSGSLQGLSNLESADSESVDELIEEGNAFEADAIAGVERAGDDEEKEVRTHEVLEDDVPEEYLDEE